MSSHHHPYASLKVKNARSRGRRLPVTFGTHAPKTAVLHHPHSLTHGLTSLYSYMTILSYPLLTC
jgi:hypothetical protein